MANHDLAFEDGVVRKRYLRTDRSQPEREWSTLVWLDEHAPGLAPRPIALEPEPPTLVMSRVPGEPLDTQFTPSQTTAMVEAYRTLFSVPAPRDMPLRFAHPADFVTNNVRWLGEVKRDHLPDVVRRALAAADEWYADAPPGVGEIHDRIVVQGDGNVANMLWDGDRVRLIDFEYAGVGDFAFEVADLVEHASSRLRRLLDPETVIAAFDLTSEQHGRVQDYRKVLATFWVLMLLPGSPGYDINPEGSAERQSEHVLALLTRRSRH
ncbi:aminoglycoside phosphotransferase family protein [Nocardioides sp. R1-1]|uniref:aminoglycoside phosphotransferase family protein n=1 Tax=Nocardioides sp. R1-1 TaxID=3383502 RepID=UPI0038D24628